MARTRTDRGKAEISKVREHRQRHDKFQKRLELDSGLKLDPTTEANRWRVQGLIEEGTRLAKQGNIKDALAAYIEARTFDPTLKISI